MRTRRGAVALITGAVTTLAAVVVLAPTGFAATGGTPARAALACTAPAWAEGTSYAVGKQVAYGGRLYEARVAHTAYPGACWNPAATPTLWKDLGACDGGPSDPPSSPPPGGDTEAPSTPGALRVTGTAEGSVTLAWTASTDNRGVTGYEVVRAGSVVATVTGTTAVVAQPCATTAAYTVRARDEAGNRSAASTAVDGTTGACSPGGPVAVPVAPYVDMGAWPPNPALADLAVAGNQKSLTLAFIVAGSCHASWFGAYDPRDRWKRDEIDALRARGGDVKISFGGATGVELAQACSSVDALAAEYQAVIDAYDLKYMDLDIEGTATQDTASVNRRSQALAKLQKANPGLKVSLTLPVLPTGLVDSGLAVVRSAIDAGVAIDVVNVMAMDYYLTPRGDYGDHAKAAAQSVFNQLKPLFPALGDAQVWRKVGVTPMIGANDDTAVFGLDDARDLVAFANSRHLGFLSLWETTRDRNACNGPLYRCTNIAQQPYDFSKIFAGFTG